jgi:uncharacterized protein YutE (UPF0331/DUF86 family)
VSFSVDACWATLKSVPLKSHELIIKHKGLRRPQSYAESFDILGDCHILDAEFAYRFARIASFRNFLAHDYEKIDTEVICGQIVNSLDDVVQYLRQICNALEFDGVR